MLRQRLTQWHVSGVTMKLFSPTWTTSSTFTKSQLLVSSTRTRSYSNYQIKSITTATPQLPYSLSSTRRWIHSPAAAHHLAPINNAPYSSLPIKTTTNDFSRWLLALGGLVAFISIPIVEAASSEQTSTTNAPSIGHAIYSFGSNQFGALGVGDEISRPIPTLIAQFNGTPIRQIVAANHVAGILTADGRVFTFGKGSDLALGHGDKAIYAQPTEVDGLIGKRICHLSLSETHGAAIELLDNGRTKVWMWGNRALGLPPPASKPLPSTLRGVVSNKINAAAPAAFSSPTPIEITALADLNVIQVACGKHHSLALTSNGRVYSFGSDRHGALGLGDGNDLTSHTPSLVAALESQRIISVAAGNGSSLFLTDKGEVFAAGNNEYGQAGTGANKRSYPTPTQIRSLRDIVALSSGAYHAFALDRGGHAYGWGWNQSGQLGLGHKNFEIRLPTPVEPSMSFSFVSSGFETSALVSSDGKLFLQGRGREGQLGRGDQLESIAASRDSPSEVTFFTSTKQTVVQAATGADFTLALVKEKADPNTLPTSTTTSTNSTRTRP